MDYCQKIQELTDLLINSKDEYQLHQAKTNLLLLIPDIQNIPENTKALMMVDYLRDIDLVIKNKNHILDFEDIIMNIRIALKQKFYCEDVQSIDRL